MAKALSDLARKIEIKFWLLPEPVHVLIFVWLVINGLIFPLGLIDAPKTKSMRFVEFFMPGYQLGLAMGSRVHGEMPIEMMR